LKDRNAGSFVEIEFVEGIQRWGGSEKRRKESMVRIGRKEVIQLG
jgi:hypothetical protein